MSRSYWRVILAAIGGLALLVATYGYYIIENSTRAEYPSNNYQPARDASFPKRRMASEPKPQAYQPNCQQPQSEGDSDLCAQWGAVKAVDESNRLVRVGIMWSYLLGAVGILTTAVGTALVYRTLSQGQAGLDATNALLKIERDRFELEHNSKRPIVHFSSVVWLESSYDGKQAARIDIYSRVTGSDIRNISFDNAALMIGNLGVIQVFNFTREEDFYRGVVPVPLSREQMLDTSFLERSIRLQIDIRYQDLEGRVFTEKLLYPGTTTTLAGSADEHKLFHHDMGLPIARDE